MANDSSTFQDTRQALFAKELGLKNISPSGKTLCPVGKRGKTPIGRRNHQK